MNLIQQLEKEQFDKLAATNELMILGVDLASRRVAPMGDLVAANLNAMQNAHATLRHPHQAGRTIGILRG